MMRTATLTLALLLGASACTRPEAAAGPQGWSAAQQAGWYGGSQGSRIMPLAWARALERPNEPGKLFDPEYLERYRLIPRGANELPVGVAVDRQDDRALKYTRLRWAAGQGDDAPWVGFNCAACHTGEIVFKGQSMRIDGGAGLLDFTALVRNLGDALAITRQNQAKWDAFARTVLGTGDTPAARKVLAGEVDKLVAFNAKLATANATPLAAGYARLDAFGHIFNKVAILAGPDTPRPNPSDAPVSFPFLWNTHQADKVQWNGIASNKQLKLGREAFDYGALARNAGEVIGVYGDVDVTGDAGLKGYASSLNLTNLNALERLLARLKPPVWPAALMGEPDAAKVAAGKALFGAQCASCHTPLARDDLKTKYVTQISLFNDRRPPGTDPWMACNAYTAKTRTGVMEGMAPRYFAAVSEGAPKFGDEAPIAQMLSATVVGALAGRKWEAVRAATDTWLGFPPNVRVQTEAVALPPTRENRLQRCMTEANAILGYRARPLTGIWATAPFLHNGSVPTLYDLLLPPAQRPAVFHVGSREYDPVKVGYVTAASPANSFRFVARIAAGPVDGNSNAGHDYDNAALSEADRWALVEYMKTL